MPRRPTGARVQPTVSAPDRAELAQVVAHAAAGHRGPVSASAAAPLEMKSTSELVVLEPLQDRVELLEERPQLAEQRLGPRQSVAQRRQAALRRVMSGSRLTEEVAQVGRQRAHVAQRRLQVARDRPQVPHERVGVDGERPQARQRRLGLVQEGREDPDRLGQRLVLARGGRGELSPALTTSLCSWPSSCGQRVEDVRRCRGPGAETALGLRRRARSAGRCRRRRRRAGCRTRR